MNRVLVVTWWSVAKIPIPRYKRCIKHNGLICKLNNQWSTPFHRITGEVRYKRSIHNHVNINCIWNTRGIDCPYRIGVSTVGNIIINVRCVFPGLSNHIVFSVNVVAWKISFNISVGIHIGIRRWAWGTEFLSFNTGIFKIGSQRRTCNSFSIHNRAWSRTICKVLQKLHARRPFNQSPVHIVTAITKYIPRCPDTILHCIHLIRVINTTINSIPFRITASTPIVSMRKNDIKWSWQSSDTNIYGCPAVFGNSFFISKHCTGLASLVIEYHHTYWTMGTIRPWPILIPFGKDFCRDCYYIIIAFNIKPGSVGKTILIGCIKIECICKDAIIIGNLHWFQGSGRIPCQMYIIVVQHFRSETRGRIHYLAQFNDTHVIIISAHINHSVVWR